MLANADGWSALAHVAAGSGITMAFACLVLGRIGLTGQSNPYADRRWVVGAYASLMLLPLAIILDDPSGPGNALQADRWSGLEVLWLLIGSTALVACIIGSCIFHYRFARRPHSYKAILGPWNLGFAIFFVGILLPALINS